MILQINYLWSPLIKPLILLLLFTILNNCQKEEEGDATPKAYRVDWIEEDHCEKGNFIPGKVQGDSLLTKVNKEPENQLAIWMPDDLVPVEINYLAPKITDENYITQLRKEAYEAYKNLFTAFTASVSPEIELRIYSAFRPYDFQCLTFYWKAMANKKQAKKELGEQATDLEIWQRAKEITAKISAYPGRSEHQLGTAVDLTTNLLEWKIDSSFAETEVFKWLQNNAHLYGFVLSYPKGTDGEKGYSEKTGYYFEPWHWRYIGIEPATYMYENSLWLADYLNLQL